MSDGLSPTAVSNSSANWYNSCPFTFKANEQAVKMQGNMLWFIKKLFWQISLLEHTDEYSGRLVNMMYRLSICNITHFFLNGRTLSWKCGESLHTKKSHNLAQASFPGLVVRLLRPILFFINSFYVAYLCDVICDLRRMSLHHDCCCLMMSLRGLHQT